MLQIPNEIVEDAWIDKRIVIKLVAASIETSELVGKQFYQEMSASYVWVKTQLANFKIKTPKNDCNKVVDKDGVGNDDDCLVLVTVDQTISIEPQGWSPIGDDGYWFIYEVLDAAGGPVLQMSLETTYFTIPKNTLREDRTYTLRITV